AWPRSSATCTPRALDRPASRAVARCRTLERMDGVEPDEGGDPPLTAEVLADLQAGLLDDDTAARLRKRVRTDPDAHQTLQALNRVRREVAALGSDESSAPPVDPAVVDGIAANLRAAHSVQRGRLPRPARMTVAAVGLAAVAVAAWLGTRALITPPEPM